MEFIDLGKKSGSMGVSPTEKNHIYYPSFNISDKKNLPVKGADIGKSVMATVKLKLTSIRESDDEGYSCSFDVLGINFDKKKVDVKNTSKEDLDDAEKKEYGSMNLTGKGLV